MSKKKKKAEKVSLLRRSHLKWFMNTFFFPHITLLNCYHSLLLSCHSQYSTISLTFTLLLCEFYNYLWNLGWWEHKRKHNDRVYLTHYSQVKEIKIMNIGSYSCCLHWRNPNITVLLREGNLNSMQNGFQ